ncbi:hypothetical protein [Microvirga brassicacearum]|uniref:Uncharacterized protein n=1 Tax=Microvirga brassicacearum TaxID=2580413 RepID=A0A5N3PCL7_9HYPH|nr:hypothetical protein [Microvirga brassicacearum]KAB0267506.1 hypothetical protein FEZ63_09405 [Microvirga brassicacearum]
MRIRIEATRVYIAAGIAILASVLGLPADSAVAAFSDRSRPEATAIRYLPSLGETQVAARIDQALCLAFSLPQEWRRVPAGNGAALHLAAATGDGAIEIAFRSMRDLMELPQADPITRDAAFLQRDHEGVFGRPAQASSLESVPGATRWTATWIDGNLPSSTHMLTLETYIVRASPDWMLEISISDIDDRDTYDTLVQRVLANLQTADPARCGRPG